MPVFDCFSLEGQQALVTGSSDGLGFEAAKLLSLAGAHVWVNGRDAARAEAAATRIQEAGGQASALPFDVSDEAATEIAFAQINEAGGLSVLVNNVGMRDRRKLSAFTREDLQRLMDVDLVSPFRLAQRAAEQMIPKGYGRIVNISSIAGAIAQKGDAAYTSAKAGINGMTRALAAELGGHGITVNAIAPGFFKTAPNRSAAANPEIAERLKRSTCLGRWGDPVELAPTILLMASPASSYLTGQVLAVDGGYTTHY